MSTPMNHIPEGSEHRDPLSGAPDFHPVGAGIGAAGAAAAGAVLGSIAGPVGTVAGAMIGGIAGGLAGKGIAETVEDTEEEDDNSSIPDPVDPTDRHLIEELEPRDDIPTL